MPGLALLTWNAGNITKGRTKLLALSHLLVENRVDAAIITETDIGIDEAAEFAIAGYCTFLPPHPCEKGKYRVIALIKTETAAVLNPKPRPDLSTTEASIWLELGPGLILGGVYRPWSGLQREWTTLEALLDSFRDAASSSKAVVIMGDLNLDATRLDDSAYTRSAMLKALTEGVESAGLEYHPTPSTWTSHGVFGGARRTSCIDHVYTAGVLATV